MQKKYTDTKRENWTEASEKTMQTNSPTVRASHHEGHFLQNFFVTPTIFFVEKTSKTAKRTHEALAFFAWKRVERERKSLVALSKYFCKKKTFFLSQINREKRWKQPANLFFQSTMPWRHLILTLLNSLC
jgi:hypothetical protein